MILLGSTGSIGVNTLLIAQRFHLDVEVLSCGKNITLLNEQIAQFQPRIVVVQDAKDVLHVNHTHVYVGAEGILEAIREAKSDLVVNAIVGFAGLRATLEALTCKKKIALANKESLVAGGKFIDPSRIQPIDSEHFGLWFLLQKERPIERMVITASGGSFRDWPLEKLKNASLSDALKHPNWSMGRKITIDSASMMNKLFELLEARWLFGEGSYDAVIETQSLIHALIDYKDGSTTAHFAHADMKLPIAYAVNGTVEEQILKPIDLVQVGSLEFREITKERYRAWELKADLLENPNRGVIVNAANEVAIEQFIAGKIGFLEISQRILKTYEHFDKEPESIEAVFAMDDEVRHFVRAMV
ncbi:MAG: 1-deoxy-D-xylulose-5-phosphate reductoisomerase [Campylobacterota bacterium]|nr:1-deoxy-D-xylulose-5-phosphate reductoisomerase [Campylobacterota bacterium]